MSDTQVLIGIVIFLSAVALLNSFGLPSEYQFISNYGIAGIGASALAVAAACVISTGLPCAAALVATNVIFTGIILVSSIPMISMLITGPINMTVSWLMFRLARGGGSA